VSPRRDGGEAAVVPRAEPASYYGRPVLKEPVWTWEIPWYLFAGGLAGASAPLAVVAEVSGNARLARRAWAVMLAGVTASPALLIADLGRPERFLNMLRVVKVTSPMSLGSWGLVAAGPAAAIGTAHAWLGWFPRLSVPARVVALALGPTLTTYTAVLLADTAVPAWHAGRHELPFVFAGSAMASAGGAAAALTPRSDAGPARRLAVVGAALGTVTMELMRRRLGVVGEPYRAGRSGRFARSAQILRAGGAALLGARGRGSRAAAVIGGAGVVAGAICQRWAVFEAGKASARDPKYTIAPQRERLATSD
jgi:Polysulphide reductase, NrfD